MKSQLVGALVAASLLVAAGSPTTAVAGAAAKPPAATTAPKSKLAKSYPLSTGQFAGVSIVPSLISNFHLVDVPVLAAYDSKEDKIAILLFGNQGTVDAAKEEIEAFQEKAIEPVRNLIELTHGLKLVPEDFYLAYYDVSRDKYVLEWKNGEYKMR